jgi:hypothetical protein
MLGLGKEKITVGSGKEWAFGPGLDEKVLVGICVVEDSAIGMGVTKKENATAPVHSQFFLADTHDILEVIPESEKNISTSDWSDFGFAHHNKDTRGVAKE